MILSKQIVRFFCSIAKFKPAAMIGVSFFIVVTANTAFAQNPNLAWAKSMGSASLDWGFGIVTDANQNVYTCGTFTGNVDFDPGPGTFNLNGNGEASYISKLDASGNFIWAKKIGNVGPGFCHALSITLDASSNILIRGEFAGTVDFDPGAGTYNLSPPQADTILFICKLDAAGNFIWAKAIDANSTGTFVNSTIITDNSGNVIIAGSFFSTGDFDPGPGVYNMTPVGNTDGFILKLDAGGNFVWAKQISGALDEACWDIRVDKNGNIFTGGSFQGTVDFDPGPGVYNLTSTIGGTGSENFMLKLDAAGNFLWVKAFARGDDLEQNLSFTLDAMNNLYIAGTFSGVGDFDPGPGTFFLTPVNQSFYNTYILKLDATGNFVWAKQFNATQAVYPNAISVDPAGNIYVCGAFSKTADFSPGTGTYVFKVFGGNDIDSYVCKLDASGNTIWAMQLGGKKDDSSIGITTDAAGDIYLTGYFSTTADFDPCAGTYILTSAGSLDIFVAKFTPPVDPSTVSLTVTPSANDICPDAVVTFTAAPFNINGITPSLQWKLNGNNVGVNSATYNATNFNNGDKISCVMSFDATCTAPAVVNSNTVTMITKPVPGISITPVNPILSFGGSVQLNATINGTNTGYIWVPSAGLNNPTVLNPVASPLATTVYSLLATAPNGCIGKDSVTVNVVKRIFIPNSFTPNGDGINDIFQIPAGATFTLETFTVYDRYGNAIFKTSDINKGWDGTYKGSRLPQGSYTYLIKGADLKGKFVVKGSVVLIR